MLGAAVLVCMMHCLAAGVVRAETGAPALDAGSPYRIDRWETDHGMPDNSATAIAQAPDGYLWISTFNGLVRFDGSRFVVIDTTNTPELPSAGIVNLHLDQSGRLWVSTVKGLVVRDGASWRTIDKRDGWRGDFVRSFSERKNGDLLLTTFDGLVLQFSAGRFTELAPPGSRDSAYLGVADHEGRWWVTQQGYVGVWDGQRWSKALSTTAADAPICASARDGGHWVLLGQQLIKFGMGGETGRIDISEPIGGVWSIHEAGDGNVWICTHDRGLYRISPDGCALRWSTANELTHEGVRFVFQDREQNLWVGSSGGGLMRFKEKRVQHFGLASGISERVVTSVAPDGDGVWVGTYGAGLFRLAQGVATSAPASGSAARSPHIQAVMTDRSGRTWVGSYAEGLLLLEDGAATRFPIERTGGRNILALFEDSQRRIWISGGDGIAVLDGGDARAAEPTPVADIEDVCSFVEDAAGRIWFTDQRRVYRLEDGQCVEVNDADGASLRGVACFRNAVDGSVWMGTRADGLLRWRAGQIDRVGESHGLPANSISGILEDDRGFWWMASERGIVRAERRELEAVTDGLVENVRCQLLGKQDGMEGADCPTGRQPVCGIDGNGVVWFATSRGVASVDSQTFATNDVPPMTHIERVSFEPTGVGGGRVDSEQGVYADYMDIPIVLPAGSRHIEIQYTATSLVAAELVQFQVMLEGRDRSWRSVRHLRTAVFNELPPGDYVFHVRACNNDGLWSPAGDSVALSVLPFVWQTTWFRAGAGLAMCTGSAGVALGLARNQRRRRRQSEERFRLAVEAAPNAMITTNAEGLMTLVNSQTEKDFGYARDEMLGRPIGMLLANRRCNTGDVDNGREFSLTQARRAGPGRELIGLRKDGSEIPIEVGLNQIGAAGGLCTLASIVNVSERKRAELELAHQRNELAHLSRVTMLGELSGALAHELNQPLTAILSNAQAAQRFMASPNVDMNELRDILGDIVEQDKRAGEVIHRLRLLLKKGEVQKQALDVSEAVREVLKLMQSELINHGVETKFESPVDLPLVSGDRVHLQQVLLNLIKNGCDAMAEVRAGERRLLVRAERDAEMVQISVSDVGCGITADQMPRIFEPFYTTKSTGMGLGLAVCRTIIRSLNGELWAMERADRGATFCFTLPVHEEGKE